MENREWRIQNREWLRIGLAALVDFAAEFAVEIGVAARTLDEGVAGGAGGIFHSEVLRGVAVEFVCFGSGFRATGWSLLRKYRLGGSSFFFGSGFRGLGRVSLVMLFELAVFTLEAAFGGSFVAQHEIVALDEGVGPVIGSGPILAEKVVKVLLAADARPFGLGGFEDEGIEEGVFFGLIAVGPDFEEEEPIFFAFAGLDESFGAGAVFEGVLGGLGFAGFRRRSGAATVAFFAGSV